MRFGFRASLMRAVLAPVTPRSSTVTGTLSTEYATTILPILGTRCYMGTVCYRQCYIKVLRMIFVYKGVNL